MRDDIKFLKNDIKFLTVSCISQIMQKQFLRIASTMDISALCFVIFRLNTTQKSLW